MEKGQHEVRTPRSGVRVGNRSVIDGQNVLHVKQGKTEDFISLVELVEAICGVPVKKIVFHGGTVLLESD